MSGLIRCHICRENRPAAFADGHHERPQATGPSHKRTPLCTGCHNNLHRVVHLMTYGKNSEAEDAVVQMYKVPQQRRRLFDLAKEALRWQQLKKDGKLEPVGGKVTIELPAAERAALTVLAKQQRHPKTGRPMGIKLYLERVVIQHIHAVMPSLKHQAGGHHG
jgi:hypothetical protein